MITQKKLTGLILLLSVWVSSLAQDISVIGKDGWKLWLDRSAYWENDSLYLPPADLSVMDVNPPTCGWNNLFKEVRPESESKGVVANPALSLKVNVPGTVEEYFWDALSNDNGYGNSGDYVGVSWWGCDFKVPASERGKRIKLFFSEGIRQRAEVFVNQKLVGYELAHQLPFEVDITDVAEPGKVNKLAVRITDPNGNFHWSDFDGERWGEYQFPLSHGFGGILGEVQLKAVSPVYVSDVFVKNKPSLTDIDVDIELRNESNILSKRTVDVEIIEAWQKNAKVKNPRTVFSKSLGTCNVMAGKSFVVTFSASVPEAKLWEIKNANLYNVIVTIKDEKGKITDRYTQRFGFRFLCAKSEEGNTQMYLNGKRTLLISSISWGFWPTNGIYPTRELARKHIESAFALGQNMLNFHRCIGNTRVLDMADEMGILYYEEPGGYNSYHRHPGSDLNSLNYKDAIAPALTYQRLLRLVKRDRNHPSLVQYNLINEPPFSPDEGTKKNMAEAHLLDPTRLISYGSGFMSLGKDQAIKLHMLPYDQTQRTYGYCDIHNAGGSPGVYVDGMYNSSRNFWRNATPKDEIYVLGEEGALASPPQLELIVDDISMHGNRNGWDGADYKKWYSNYKDYIESKGLSRYYPSITKLITSMGDVMYYEHGRILENARIADAVDLYVYNGFEDMKNDNFSGAVDVFRNLKGTPELISQYARPLFIATKVTEKIGHVGDTNYFDMYVINEHAVPAGKYLVQAFVESPHGTTSKLFEGSVKVSGGDTFSDLVTEQVPVHLTDGFGYYKIKSELIDLSGKQIASGHDEIFAVDWKSDVINGKGAVIGDAEDVLSFAKGIKHADIEKFSPDMGKLDYIILCSNDRGSVFQPVSSSCFRAKDGSSQGLDIDYFRGVNFETHLDQRITQAPIDFNTTTKPIPGWDILGNNGFSLRWEGFIVAQATGETSFELSYDDGARMWFDGEEVIFDWRDGGVRPKVFKNKLEAGKAYPVKMEFYQSGGGWEFALKWKIPVRNEEIDMTALLDRVKNQGTKLILMEDAEEWMEKLQNIGAVPSYKVFHPAKSWVGSSFFVREHPFFNNLPVDGAMNWEYQRLVLYDGPKHFGLYDLTGEEAIVSLVGYPFKGVSTSVGILPYGKGKIVFSSLDLISNLSLDVKSSNVPKKIFCNYLKWATYAGAVSACHHFKIINR